MMVSSPDKNKRRENGKSMVVLTNKCDELLPAQAYDEEKVKRMKQKMLKLGYSSKIGDMIQLFIYVIPKHLKLVR